MVVDQLASHFQWNHLEMENRYKMWKYTLFDFECKICHKSLTGAKRLIDRHLRKYHDIKFSVYQKKYHSTEDNKSKIDQQKILMKLKTKSQEIKPKHLVEKGKYEETSLVKRQIKPKKKNAKERKLRLPKSMSIHDSYSVFGDEPETDLQMCRAKCLICKK